MSTPLIFRLFLRGMRKNYFFWKGGGEWAISDVGTVLLFSSKRVKVNLPYI